MLENPQRLVALHRPLDTTNWTEYSQQDLGDEVVLKHEIAHVLGTKGIFQGTSKAGGNSFLVGR